MRRPFLSQKSDFGSSTNAHNRTTRKELRAEAPTSNPHELCMQTKIPRLLWNWLTASGQMTVPNKQVQMEQMAQMAQKVHSEILIRWMNQSYAEFRQYLPAWGHLDGYGLESSILNCEAADAKSVRWGSSLR